MFIYKITNLVNGKIYIGQTTRTLKERWKGHRFHKGCKAINRAIKKYKEINFKIELLETCNSLEELNNKEQKYIKELNSLIPNGYNICIGGNGPMLGRKHSKIAKRLIGAAAKNRKASPQTRKALSISKLEIKNPMYGKKGILHHNSKKIICIELNKVFNSIWEASRELDLFAQNINKVLKRKRNSCGGYTFKYLEE